MGYIFFLVISKYFQSTVQVLLQYFPCSVFSNLLELLHYFPGTLNVLSHKFQGDVPGTFQVLSNCVPNTFLILSQYFPGNLLVFSLFFPGTSLALSYFHSSFLVLNRYFNGAFLVPSRYFPVVSQVGYTKVTYIQQPYDLCAHKHNGVVPLVQTIPVLTPPLDGATDFL